MNTTQEALKMAIKYAEETISLVNIEYETALHSGKKYAIDEAKKISELNHTLINACKEALAEEKKQYLNLKCKSVQKRLATQWGYVKVYPTQEPVALIKHENGNFSPKHTHPAKQLSDDEILTMIVSNDWDMLTFARAIEAKIREE